VKSSVFLKWGLFFLMVSFYLGTQNVTFSASQEKAAVSKTPPAEKKQPPNESDESLPEIFLETKEHDGGVVYEGNLVTHSFAVKNKGKGELHIKSVKPG
jgi:hypothetical protein